VFLEPFFTIYVISFKKVAKITFHWKCNQNMLFFRGKSPILKLMLIEQNLARQLLLRDRTTLPEPTGGR